MASQFEGFDAVAATLRELRDPRSTGKVLGYAVRKGMEEPKRLATQLIPVGKVWHYVGRWKGPPGRLVPPGFARACIRVVTKVERSGQRAYALLGVRAFAYYAVQFLEIGTSKMAAHPWLRPAFLQSKDPTVRIMATGINDWIREVAAKHRSGAHGYRGGAARADQLEATASQFSE